MTTAVITSGSGTQTLAQLVAEVGPDVARCAAEHDREGTFVSESYAALKSAGFFGAAVPVEFGGLGAGLRELAFAHHDLAAYCGSTALASAMHTHTVATLAWRHRRNAPVGPTLQKVVDAGLVLVSTGGSDLVRPTAVATRVEGGFLVSGRKVFVSQAPAGSMLATAAVTDVEPIEILSLSIPMSSPGVEILDTWDAHGMRGTGSHDVMLSDVYVSDAQVGAHRPLGKLDPLMRIALINGLTIISGVYLGLADAARAEAVRFVTSGQKANDPVRQRLIGDAESHYAASRLAFEGSLCRLGDDPESTMENFMTVLQAKRAIAEHGAKAIDSAMAAVGGKSFYRSSLLERIERDFRGITHHPLTPEETVFYAGGVALGGDPQDL